MRIASKLFSLVFVTAFIACGYLSVKHLVIPTESMLSTIESGDHLALVGVKDNEVDPIVGFEIVGYHRLLESRRGIDEKTLFVGRIIGLPSEKVELRKGTVFVNDQVLDESSFGRVSDSDTRKPVFVPTGEYYILGDNRPNSGDSRYIGTIKRSDIEGKVTKIIRKADYNNGKRW